MIFLFQVLFVLLILIGVILTVFFSQKYEKYQKNKQTNFISQTVDLLKIMYPYLEPKPFLNENISNLPAIIAHSKMNPSILHELQIKLIGYLKNGVRMIDLEVSGIILQKRMKDLSVTIKRHRFPRKLRFSTSDLMNIKYFFQQENQVFMSHIMSTNSLKECNILTSQQKLMFSFRSELYNINILKKVLRLTDDLVFLEENTLNKVQKVPLLIHELKSQNSSTNTYISDLDSSIYTMFSNLGNKVRNIEISDSSVILEPFSGMFTRISFTWDKNKIEMKTLANLRTKMNVSIEVNKDLFNDSKINELNAQDFFSFNIVPDSIKQNFLEDPSIINHLRKLDYENVSSLILKLSISNGMCSLFVITSANPNNIFHLYQLAEFFSSFLQNLAF